VPHRRAVPAEIAPDVIKALTEAGVEARYFELDSDLGHSSSGPEHAKWSPVLREFLAPLVARLTEAFALGHQAEMAAALFP
jgi:hypothetical protein